LRAIGRIMLAAAGTFQMSGTWHAESLAGGTRNARTLRSPILQNISAHGEVEKTIRDVAVLPNSSFAPAICNYSSTAAIPGMTISRFV
jgi:hypothetical protein